MIKLAKIGEKTAMNEFLYTLAEIKYRMYHELFIFKPTAYTDDECNRRIKYLAKYEQTLAIINLLPIEEERRLRAIENEYFSDAPYVSK